MMAVLGVGIGVLIFGCIVLLIFPERPGGEIHLPGGMSVNSKGAGLPITVLGGFMVLYGAGYSGGISLPGGSPKAAATGSPSVPIAAPSTDGTSTDSTPTFTPAPRAPATQFLTDLQPTDQTYCNCMVQSRSANINGITYPHNLSFVENSSSTSGYQTYTVYTIARHYRRFTAVAGVEDTAPSTTTFKVEAFADGRQLFSQTMRKGEDAHLALDMTGVYELKLVVTRAQPPPAFGEYTGDNRLGFGDAQLIGAS